MHHPDPVSPEYEQAVATRWAPRDPTIRSFWQSPVVLTEVNRRITGDPLLTPLEYFVNRYCPRPWRRALSVGCGDAGFELELMRSGLCDRMVAVDLSQDRLDRAQAAATSEVAERLELVCANIEKWRPEGQFDLVIVRDALHHLERLEDFFDALDELVSNDGLVYVDEFVGPSRFQWTDKQLEIINRLLDRLDPELRKDLVDADQGVRSRVARPSIAGLISSDPSESARSEEIPGLLRTRLAPVEERPWGGAIFHQLFNRIMGNFARHPDIVRLIMEFDAILTEEGVVGSDYLWGVYRRREERRVASAGPQTVGRLESVEGHTLVGWAVDPSFLDARADVDVYIDHKLVARRVANLVRSDLAREGFGDGAHAFRIKLPGWPLDGRQHSISAVIPSMGHTLPAARLWTQRNRTAPEGTELVWARHDLSLPPAQASRVLRGVEGWAFPCDDAVGSIEQMLGRLRLTESNLSQWRMVLERNAHEVRRLGAHFMVGVIPAKAAIHPERLGPSSPPMGPPRLGRQLFASLGRTFPFVIDLLPPLLEAARDGRQLFFKRDSHLNYAGAMLAASRLAGEARRVDSKIVPVPPEAVSWKHASLVGDLAGRPGANLVGDRLEPAPATAGPETYEAPDEQALGLRRLSRDTHALPGNEDATVVEVPDRTGGATALVVYDPGGERLLPFLAAAFARSVWVCAAEVDLELVSAVEPSVVIHLLDEPLLLRVAYG